ncbi:hypothetical protein M404DRAFT_487145 [Pisolithus tinctorius Marx 270]|uniref:Uncharacterized protein n=1 Tax=Pisolithus tinctorius Marx 270 TaxID=870435 RepID=A0A0C3I977_PISTI|nr:hypothetical protein M404DRAFT_487145 [Pisolithus tinctorius Marx 270]
MENQTRLSEYLRVLQHLGYSHPSTRSNSAHRDRKTDEEIRILDTLAVALTSGTRGEVIATSFNKREPVTLLLAKNTPCDATDREAVQELVKRITSPQTQNFENVLPFLFVHCKVNMMNRISKLLKALKEFRSDLQTILGIHGPFSSLAEEFPGSEEYRAWKYGQRVPSFSEMLHDLLEDIQETARTLNIENPGQPSVDLFVILSATLSMLQSSRLLRLRSTTEPSVELLHDRINYVCQYSQGVDSLIVYAKHYFPNGIPCLWLEAPADSAETIFKLKSGYKIIIERAFHRTLFPDNVQELLHRQFPYKHKWKKSVVIKTRVHAEIQLVLYLSKAYFPLDPQRPHPIGTSKRSCMCCALWIREYNEQFSTYWMTSGSHGKAYPAWALPGVDSVDKRVREEVENQVIAAAKSIHLFPQSPRSDEFRSRNTGMAVEPASIGQLIEKIVRWRSGSS